jgi:hypothetical protein
MNKNGEVKQASLSAGVDFIMGMMFLFRGWPFSQNVIGGVP